MQVIVMIDGQQHGPYTPEEVRHYLFTGQLQPEMPAWCEGLKDWQPLGTFPEFSSLPARPGQKPGRSRTTLYAALAAGAVALCAAGAWFVWHRKPSGGSEASTPSHSVAESTGHSAATIPQNPNNFETVQQAPDRAALDAQIAEARRWVGNSKTGHIAVGRVTLEGTDDPADVIAQMLILPGGYFAAPIQDFALPLTFRMHGYAPLDVDLSGKHGDLVDIGTVRMNKLAASEMRQIAGTVVLESSKDPRGVKVALTASAGPVNPLNGGSSPRPHWPAPVTLWPDENGRFSARGFSPATYYCTINAPGCVQFAKSISFDQPEGIDLGTIRLELARQCKLSYFVADQPPFDLAKKQQSSIPGGGNWKATPDIYGWDLAFLQQDGRIHFGSSYFPCALVDLGEGALQDFAKTTTVPDSNFQRMNVEAVGGHVYLLHQEYWKRWVLFKVESVR